MHGVAKRAARCCCRWHAAGQLGQCARVQDCQLVNFFPSFYRGGSVPHRNIQRVERQAWANQGHTESQPAAHTQPGAGKRSKYSVKTQVQLGSGRLAGNTTVSTRRLGILPHPSSRPLLFKKILIHCSFTSLVAFYLSGPSRILLPPFLSTDLPYLCPGYCYPDNISLWWS